MEFRREGNRFVLASEYHAIIRDNLACVVLLIAAEPNQLKMANSLQGVKGNYETFVIPVSDEDAVVVEALKVPRLRVFEKGIMVHDYVLDKSDTSSIVTVLQKIGIF